jgi:hypothetical protein
MSAFQTFYLSPSAAAPPAPRRRRARGQWGSSRATWKHRTTAFVLPKGKSLIAAKTAAAHFSRRASRIRNCGITGHARIYVFRSLPSCSSVSRIRHWSARHRNTGQDSIFSRGCGAISRLLRFAASLSRRDPDDRNASVPVRRPHLPFATHHSPRINMCNLSE